MESVLNSADGFSLLSVFSQRQYGRSEEVNMVHNERNVKVRQNKYWSFILIWMLWDCSAYSLKLLIELKLSTKSSRCWWTAVLDSFLPDNGARWRLTNLIRSHHQGNMIGCTKFGDPCHRSQNVRFILRGSWMSMQTLCSLDQNVGPTQPLCSVLIFKRADTIG